MASSSSSIAVVSWNVLADSYVKPEFFPFTDPAVLEPAARRPRVIARLREMATSTDVLCLQEVEPEVFARANDALDGFEGAYVQKRGKPDGCALFVREALGRATFRELAFTDGTGHVALAASLDELALSVATTHLKWQAPDIPLDERLGLRELVELLDAWVRPPSPWIVCGDLNASNDSPILQAAFARGLRDAYGSMPDAFTCNSNGRAKRIDFLLASPELVPTPSPLPRIDDVTPLPSASEASDHLAIRATFARHGP